LIYAILLSLTIGAPAPLPKPSIPPLEITPGYYLFTWGNEKDVAILEADGSYRYPYIGITYIGKWEWDSKKRVFTIHEKNEKSLSNDLACYTFVFDANLITINKRYSLKRLP
jgi:hypothetical protein